MKLWFSPAATERLRVALQELERYPCTLEIEVPHKSIAFTMAILGAACGYLAGKAAEGM